VQRTNEVSDNSAYHQRSQRLADCKITSAHLVATVVATALLTLGIRLILNNSFDLELEHRFWYRDFAGNLVVSVFFFSLTRHWLRAMIVASLFLCSFHFGNAGKLVVLGTPFSPDDFMNVKNLFMLSKDWLLVVAIASITLPIGAFVLLVRWRALSTWVSFGVFFSVVSLGIFYSTDVRSSLDREFGNSEWNQPLNYKTRGLMLHIVQESMRTLSKVKVIPTQANISSLMAALPHHRPDIKSTNKRNVHMIVLESFFDPNTLGKQWVPEDPLPEEFHALWNATDKSTALTPVFGGYTANAEFEVLCGFPFTGYGVFFEGFLRHNAPCLPAMLAQQGYRSIASHPNVPGFWNRKLAYHLTGFDTFWSKADFDISDSVSGVLLDHSFYDQVFDKLGELDDGPVFNYMLTYHGHYPYSTNENYPNKVKAGKDSWLLQGYLNHVYYKSRDLMALVSRLRQDDPEALVVIFGDHLPSLGSNFGVYTDAGKLAADRKNFTPEMLRYSSSTPLIVINGRQGPQKLGQVPLYRLPAIVTGMLGSTGAGIAGWSSNPPGKIIRPVYRMHYYLQDGKTIACGFGSKRSDCIESQDWITRVKTLSTDIFAGAQHSLQYLDDVSAN